MRVDAAHEGRGEEQTRALRFRRARGEAGERGVLLHADSRSLSARKNRAHLPLAGFRVSFYFLRNLLRSW